MRFWAFIGLRAPSTKIMHNIFARRTKSRRTEIELTVFTPPQLLIWVHSGAHFSPWAHTPTASPLLVGISASKVRSKPVSGLLSSYSWTTITCAFPTEARNHSGHTAPTGPRLWMSVTSARIRTGRCKLTAVHYGISKRFTRQMLRLARKVKEFYTGRWREPTSKRDAEWTTIRKCNAFSQNRTSAICTIGI